MECDGCMACCITPPIDDGIIVKEDNTVCKFCDRGCAIYEDRPPSCVNFNCLYITDGYDESLRPDKTGVIFDKIRTKVYHALVSNDYVDTWETIQMKQYIKSLNDQEISVVVSAFSTGIITALCAKEHTLEKVLQIALESNN